MSNSLSHIIWLSRMIICYLRYDIYSLYELYSTNDSYVKREGDDFLPTKKCQDRGAQYTAETPTTQTTVQFLFERRKTKANLANHNKRKQHNEPITTWSRAERGKTCASKPGLVWRELWNKLQSAVNETKALAKVLSTLIWKPLFKSSWILK